jgi:tellurite resistance protein TehA-like permease
MWEEDPRWQAANYRLLIGSTVVLTLLATGWSILERDWEFLRYWFSGLGAIVAALCIYATLVWLVAHTVRLVARLIRRFFHRGGPDA